jgi:hypothetical protein
MEISRTGTCPRFVEYITKQALIPKNGQLSPEFQRIVEYGGFLWIDIPSYQRGIVWDDEKFEELLSSTSIFIGNAILGAFPVDRTRHEFATLPANVNQYLILIDGLQRFSIGTAVLNWLAPRVFAAHPTQPLAAPFFAGLKTACESLTPVFQHNDQALRMHDRTAVRESYSNFSNTLALWLESEFTKGNYEELASKILHLFLRRQISPDIYHGFLNPYDVANTFIGLNTVRVQLGIVDQLRSVIVDQASQCKWLATDIEQMENRFTEVFVDDKSGTERGDLRPFAAVILAALIEDKCQNAVFVFPEWKSALSRTCVSSFLDFVEEITLADIHPTVREIRLTGTIPFAGLLCYYYRRFLQTGNKPSFIKGGSDEDAELLFFLRANYRALLSGKIGRTRIYARKLLIENQSLAEVSDELSFNIVQVTLGDRIDRARLVAMLKVTDQKKAPRVFNGCLLPDNAVDTSFEPLIFGTKAKHYQVDHIYPDSAVTEYDPGHVEAKTILNFAPIRRTANNKNSNLKAADKMKPGGSYERECNEDEYHHPYLDWLIETQGSLGSHLDDQEKLQDMMVDDVNIGGARLEWLVEALLPRL